MTLTPQQISPTRLRKAIWLAQRPQYLRRPKLSEDHLGAFPDLCTFAIKEKRQLVNPSLGLFEAWSENELNQSLSVPVAQRTPISITKVISCHMD
jgi:hypothetical protein